MFVGRLGETRVPSLSLLHPTIWVLLLACGSAPVRVPFDVSAPTVIPGGVLGRIDSDGLTTIYMDGLDLKIAVQNQRPYERRSNWGLGIVPYPFPMVVPTVSQEAVPTESTEPSPLVVLLRFDVRDEGFLFNPDRVTVDPDDGSVQSIEAFKGPAVGECSGEWVGSDSSRDFELPRGRTTCFLLRFPTKGSPDVHFGFHVSGVIRRGEPTPPIDLRFIKFKGHSPD